MGPIPSKTVEPRRLDGVTAPLPPGTHLVIRPETAWRPSASVGMAETFLQVIPALAKEATGTSATEVPTPSTRTVPGGSPIPDVVRPAAAHAEILAAD